LRWDVFGRSRHEGCSPPFSFVKGGVLFFNGYHGKVLRRPTAEQSLLLHRTIHMSDFGGMDELDEIIEIMRFNEGIARKFFAVEQEILAIDNFKGLFEELLFHIERVFAVPHVWVAIAEGSELSSMLTAAEPSPLLQQRLILVPGETLNSVFADKITPVLANQQLNRFYRFLPGSLRYQVRSLAIAPLTMDGQLVGSFNQGDSNPARYRPDLDTFFLAQLAVKVSLCLSNVTAHEKLRRLATRDPLTDLYNRRELDTVLRQELTQAARYGHSLALIFLDCDDFKRVNDRYGHDCGDALLKHVAGLMRKTLRTSDRLFRFAGDEFVVILPHQSLPEGQFAAQRLCLALRNNPLVFRGHTIAASISCGVASTEDLVELEPGAFLKVADSRLYAAKARKRSGQAT
jgi:diguanylate cyclase (GGDEF)-like protein